MSNPQHEPDDEPERPEKALLEQYRRKFGKDPEFFATSMMTDPVKALREAIRTGTPIELNIPPGADA